jgi:DNA gyrase subunit B
VRKRPGMYIGPTDINGLHHMIIEVVDNSVDEALAGYADQINIIIHADASVTVSDNGRGIPVDLHPTKKVSGLELAATVLHAGGKFDSDSYKVSSGLHGVGLSVVNALSTWMRIEVTTRGKLWRQEYRIGKPQGPVKVVGSAEGRGTRVNFMPDVTIFKDGIDYNFRVMVQRFREMAYLTKGLRFHIVDERDGNEVNFYFEGGIRSYVRHLNKEKSVLHKLPFYCERDSNGVAVEVAVQYTEAYDTDSIYAFANNINNTDGGAHLTGFRNALTRVINNYARGKSSMLKENEANLTGDDVREGLTAVISVKLQDPQFSSQTKEKLVSPEATSAVSSVFGDAFNTWLEENPGDAKRIIEKCVSAARTRLAVQKVRETARKGAMEGFSLPGKLADCSDTNPARCEIYIVEGDSAGGCLFSGTGVKLSSGIVKSMRELAEDWEQGIQHFGYASDEHGDVRIVPLVHPRLTKRDAELVEVELDNGETIRCTPDHPFRLRDGSYKRADQLQPDESLMPLKQRFSQLGTSPRPGYEQVWMNGRGSWQWTHRLADQYNLDAGVYNVDQGNVRHHRDFNRHNNDPRNIVRMQYADHLQLHSETARKQWEDPAYRQYITDCVKRQRQDVELNERLLNGFYEWFEALSSEEYDIYCDRLEREQAEYWASDKHRAEQSERVRRYFEDHPEAREHRRQKALEQWSNEVLRDWRSLKTQIQWEDEAYRRQHAEVVSQWWDEHPEHREKIVAARKRGWADEQTRERIQTALGEWRASTSSAEKGALIREGHRRRALTLLNRVLSADDPRAAYEQLRIETARTAPSYERLVASYFEGDEARAYEAAANFNCKVAAVRKLDERADVYDLTVDGYHNFALASGIFVHNSAKQGRDRRFQAILPLRGKILNVEKSRLDKMLSNNEVRALITAIGASVGDQFDLAKLRYHRIVIMTDADVDGSHIRTLLLTFFFRYMRPIIASGHLYIAQPPLFSVKHGKEMKYVYNESERDTYLQTLAKEVRDRAHIQRYKGLGEMNAEQLWETTMNPLNRTMGQVTLEDAQVADETFTMLMGDLVPPRKRFIQTHALEVRNLDI